MDAGPLGGEMERISLRFRDSRLEERFQLTSGREGRNGYVFAAGTSAVLWPIAGWLLPQGTVLLTGLAGPVAVTMSLISVAFVAAARWALTMDRQHGLLSLLTSANGLVILGLAAVADFLPGYAVSAIMVLFAYGFVSRTRFIFAALRTAVIGAGFVYVVANYTGRANLGLDAFFLAAMSVGTLVALRLLERGRRSLFHQQLVVAEQARQLELEKKKSDQLLLNVLPAPIMARLREGETTIADDYPSVTILFADIVGFTDLASHRPAAEVVGLLDDVFSAFDDLVVQRDLEKIKTIGDAYMAAGGLTDPEGDHARRVVDLGLAMQEEVDGRGGAWAQLKVRVGIHTGAASGGVIGRRKFAFDLWGDTVNVASRLEQHGVPGAVHISEQTWTQVREHFDCEWRGPTELRGRGDLQTYLVTGRRAVPHSMADDARGAAGT
jgi:adenylate cyclase